MFNNKNLPIAVLAALLTAGTATTANAGYLSAGDIASSDFGTLGTAWDPGTNTARLGGNPAEGGATWSIMGAGLSDASGFDPHGGASTDAITSLGFTQVDIETMINDSLDNWGEFSGFTNLGQVVDGNVGMGASEASGGALGDIRIGAIADDGPSNTLAHAYQPGNEAIFPGGGGSIAGDVHIDSAEDWVNSIDLASVLLHELGHSLGLDHSNDTTSVMYAFYQGPNTTLSADDLAGIQSIYGVSAVPVPAAVWLFMSGIGALGLIGRRRAKS